MEEEIKTETNQEENQEKAMIDELNQKLERVEELLKNQAGGKSEGAIPAEKPKEITPQEYARKILNGEANPLREDGLI